MWRFILVSFGFLGFAFYELSGGAEYRPDENSLQAHMQRERNKAGDTDLRVATTDAAPKTQQAPQAEPSAERLPDVEIVQASTGQSGDDAAIDAAVTAALEQEEDEGVSRPKPALASRTKTTSQTKTSKTKSVTRAVIGLEELAQQSRDNVQLTLANSSGQRGFGALGHALEIEQQTVASDATQSDVTNATSGTTDVTKVIIADSTPTDLRKVTGNLVNMRAGPGIRYESVDQLDEGTKVQVLEDMGNGWLRLRVQETGLTGYMADWLLSSG